MIDSSHGGRCLHPWRAVLFVLCVLLDVRAGSVTDGAEPAKPASITAKPLREGSSLLDQELLKDLDNELLDNVPNSPADMKSGADKARSGARPAAPGEPEPPGSDKQVSDDEQMGEDIGEGPEDPLARIGREMRKVERLIEQAKSARTSEPLRREIVKQLAQLIEQIEQQQQTQSSSASQKTSQSVAQRELVKQSKPSDGKSGSGQANQPARDSTDRLGRNETQGPDANQIKGMMKDLWGQLPAHAREQMLQTSPEQFVPRYELLIEKYYKRLAEQQKHEP